MNFEVALFIAITMLIGNAFFVGAEFGLISARRSSIELRALKGSRAAKITLAAMENVSFMLAGAQLGVTVCSLVLGAVGEPLIAHLLEGPFHSLGLSDVMLHLASFTSALIIMIYFHVVIGEMVPKNLALADSDRTALLLTPALVFVVKMLHPIVVSLNAFANLCLRIIGIKPQAEIASTFTRDEVAGFVEESKREGLISKDESSLLAGALSLDDRTVRAILLPLDKIVTAKPKVTALQIEKLAAETGYSRFPVRKSDGGLRGYVHLKDILSIAKKSYDLPIPTKDIRPLAVVSIHASLRATLATMQKTDSHLAQVTNEHGHTVGVVTLEDVLEEFVGTIHDGSQKRRRLS